MRRLIAVVVMVATVAASGCSDDSDSCFPPELIRLYCAEGLAMRACACDKGPIDIEAYVDLMRLPKIDIVASAEDYGRTVVGLRCAEYGPGGISIDYDPDYSDAFYPPVLIRISDAYIVTEMMPGNGVSIATWHIEIESMDQVRFWLVQDGVEVPLDVEIVVTP